MKLRFLVPALLLSASALPQTAPPPDPFAPLSFLIGSWEAKTTHTPNVTAGGTYTFVRELNNHVLARHTLANSTACKGPRDFNCDHGDLLYVYSQAPGEPLRAIYFDNEGHVIHYTVTSPSATTAEFLSDSSRPGPQFRLFYELRDNVMTGKFEIRMPGSAWKSYLEWAGRRAASQ